MRLDVSRPKPLDFTCWHVCKRPLEADLVSPHEELQRKTKWSQKINTKTSVKAAAVLSLGDVSDVNLQASFSSVREPPLHLRVFLNSSKGVKGYTGRAKTLLSLSCKLKPKLFAQRLKWNLCTLFTFCSRGNAANLGMSQSAAFTEVISRWKRPEREKNHKAETRGAVFYCTLAPQGLLGNGKEREFPWSGLNHINASFTLEALDR